MNTKAYYFLIFINITIFSVIVYHLYRQYQGKTLF